MRSTRMSESTLPGWNVTSSLVSWLGPRKPSAGKIEKCGPNFLASQVNLVPTSPVFSTCSCFTARLPCTTGGKGMLSVAKVSSVPRQAPWMRNTLRVAPEMVTLKSSMKERVRVAGRKYIANCAVSRGLMSSSPAGTTSILYRSSTAAMGAMLRRVGTLEPLRRCTERATAAPCLALPKLQMGPLGGTTSTFSGAPSPLSVTLTLYSPLTSNATASWYLIAAVGWNLTGIDLVSPGDSTVGEHCSVKASVDSNLQSKEMSCASSLRARSASSVWSSPGSDRKVGPKSWFTKLKFSLGLCATPLRRSEYLWPLRILRLMG
mmetsp:Transcript_14194/g.36424  ORF Transcript_14194/g.36424 Transcript_14194/m.36424 type:complete len:319 (+) Transcript_14194:1659-2615(+)